MKKSNRRGLKIISLNIEMQKHTGEVLNFFRKEDPDVLCLQEVLEPEFKVFQEKLGMEGQYVPMTIISSQRDGLVPTGIALFSKIPTERFETAYYYRRPGPTPLNRRGDMTTINRMLLWTTIEKEGERFTIGTTHFSWTPHGQADATQRSDVKTLLQILEKIPEIIFCGDFNAPRGREIFDELASHYRDHIPPEYESSLDPDLHRAGYLRLVVDGLFSTPHYRTQEVQLVCGLSDHCAIRAYVRRVSP